MQSEVGFVTVMRKTTRQHWYQSFLALATTVLVGLMPIWVGFVLETLISRNFAWSPYFSHGEFGLYSAAMLAPAIYLLLKNLSEPFPQRTVFGLLALVGVALSITVYVGVTAIGQVPSLFSLNEAFLARMSLWLYLGSLIFAFIVAILDQCLVEMSIRTLYDFEGEQLKRDFPGTEHNDAGQ